MVNMFFGTSHLPQRRFNLKLYLLIVFGLSWPFQIISVQGSGTIYWRIIFNSLTMIMVGVGTFICARYVFRDGFKNIGWRSGSRKYWLAAIGIPALTWIVPAIIDFLLGNIHLPEKLTVSQIFLVFEFFFVGLIPSFGEEIGWRGYMLGHMAQVMSPRKAVIWHGIIWYVWHFPLIGPQVFTAMQSMLPESGVSVLLPVTVIVMAVGGILVVLDSAIFAKLWAVSGSILIATVLHAAGNGFRDSLSIIMIDNPSDNIGTILTPTITILIGMYFLWKTDSTTFHRRHCSNHK
jgi:membrane protease YdiL (CAAX protease family)